MFRADREELAGKRALVTGGTQGVGAAIVSRLGAAGAKVATAARSERPSSDTSDLFVRGDVTTPDGIRVVFVSRASASEVFGCRTHPPTDLDSATTRIVRPEPAAQLSCACSGAGPVPQDGVGNAL